MLRRSACCSTGEAFSVPTPLRQVEAVSDATYVPQDGQPDLDALVATVGIQIKALRKQAGYTLDDLSRGSGVSTGLISQIERGKGNPSFATLVQIAHGLDIPIGRLFHLTEQISPVVRRAERRTLDFHGTDGPDDASYELLTPTLNGALEVLWVETQPGHDTSSTPSATTAKSSGSFSPASRTSISTAFGTGSRPVTRSRTRRASRTGTPTPATSRPLPSGSSPRPAGRSRPRRTPLPQRPGRRPGRRSRTA